MAAGGAPRGAINAPALQPGDPYYAGPNVSTPANSAGNDGNMFGNADDYMKWLQDEAAKGNEAAQDKLGSYYLGEESNKTARDWTASREDTAYQRMAKDMRAAGINPMAALALSGSPQASSSSGNSYNSNSFETKRHNEQTEGRQMASLAVSLVTTVAIIALSLL